MKKDKEWLKEKVRDIARQVGDEYLYINIQTVLELINQLDEPEKVVVPQFVVEHIEEMKAIGDTLEAAYTVLRDIYKNTDVADWMRENKSNIETFAKAWLAYPDIEVEKEPLYYIPLGVARSDGNEFYLAKTSLDVIGIDSSSERYVKDKWNAHYYRFTEKEIKNHDERYWAFAVPVAEVE